MTAAGQSIVDYAAPPVTEVVVAIAYRPLAVSVAHLGAFWEQELRTHFPTVVERPPYDAPVENLDDPSSTPFTLSFGEGHPPPRLWFLSADEQDLIQIQRDWFACNWRRVGPQAEYKRWVSRRDALAHWFDRFEGFLTDNNLGAIHPTQCEVTYINHIEPNRYWSEHGQLDRLFRFLGPLPRPLAEPEKVQFSAQYIMIDDKSKGVGRLHVNCVPVHNKKDGTPAVTLNLTARGRPFNDSISGAFDFLDLGRKYIVRTFDELATDEMHEVWGRSK